MVRRLRVLTILRYRLNGDRLPATIKQYKCVGTADYGIFFGEQDHMACHLIVLDAEQNHQGQPLAYMAMVRAKRKAHGEPDSTVWGVLTDGQ